MRGLVEAIDDRLDGRIDQLDDEDEQYAARQQCALDTISAEIEATGTATAASATSWRKAASARQQAASPYSEYRVARTRRVMPV